MPTVGAAASNLTTNVRSNSSTVQPGELALVNATGGPLTITLPTGPATNTIIAVKKNDLSTNLVTVVPAAGVTINNDSSVVLAGYGSAVTMQYDGGHWQILSTALVNAGAGSTGGIPAGGNSGQVLAKTSATNYDANWVTPASASPAFPPWVGSGRSFYSPTIMGNMGSLTQPPNGVMTFWAVQVPNACTVASVSMISTSTVSTTIWLGIYADDPAAASSGPGARLWQATPMATNPNPQQLHTFPVNYTFTGPQTIWMAYGNAAAWSCYSVSVNTAVTNVIPQPLSALAGQALPGQTLVRTRSVSYTAAPASMSTLPTAATSSYGIPFVLYTLA